MGSIAVEGTAVEEEEPTEEEDVEEGPDRVERGILWGGPKETPPRKEEDLEDVDDEGTDDGTLITRDPSKRLE